VNLDPHLFMTHDVIKMGTCFCNGCGNRPGPWHEPDCPAWMKNEEFEKSEDVKEGEVAVLSDEVRL